jgi:hypothetical protein
MPLKIKQLVVLASAFGVAACASANQEPPVRISVASTPAGASCEAVRDNRPIGRVTSTPGLLRVTNSASTIVLHCEAPGHAPGRNLVGSVTDGATAGLYILAGGLVGLVAASATGAMYTYPADVAVTLIPQSFTTAAERDAFFDALIARQRKQAADQSDAALFEAEIARLEGLRQTVLVVG